MLVNDLFRLSFHNLLLHKIRSFLTSLGIIFGVGSVISMLAISEGANRQSLAQIEAMGIDKIIVFSKKPPITGKSSGSSTQGGMTENFSLSRSAPALGLEEFHLGILAEIVVLEDADDLQ